MRFIKGGPNFPDELLVARDEGRLVLFCGAGVSRAKAGLGDFVGLARAVADKLSIAPDKPARQLIDAINRVQPIPGVGGPISADRVFGLMERDFRSADIYGAIAEALKPEDAVDLSAHRLLLDLARGPDGNVRLITTNFDLLFEQCGPDIPFSRPPRLPDPKRSNEFNGIIHLHGHVTPDYRAAEGDGFIISSAEFGRAYLADRWAADFIKTVLESYFVLFVGYSADDPPMQYLLEALNRSPGSLNGAYALQSGSFDEAEARWFQKGVKPIVYDEANGHSALWESLTLWADRARNLDAWYDDLFLKAKVGPEKSEPHIRGQIAHAASTLDGARRIAAATHPIPADWLCTFDPFIRFAGSGRISEDQTYFDPFSAYGLDSDPIPAHEGKTSDFRKREIPDNAWNAFALTREDRQNLREEQVPALRGHFATHQPRLAARVSHLASWLEKVCNQPACVWWAAGQAGLHPDIQLRIRYSTERSADKASAIIRKAWRHLRVSWRNDEDGFSTDYYQLLDEVKVDGWTADSIREMTKLQQPHIEVKRPSLASLRAPEPQNLNLRDLVSLDVKYPHHDYDIVIPTQWLPEMLSGLRNNLQLSVALETEIGGYGLHSLNSIEPDDERSDEIFRSGINKAIFRYSNSFTVLLKSDKQAATEEARAWLTHKGPVSAHIKIWLCGNSDVTPPKNLATFFASISHDEFWNMSHQRDLLVALENRWAEMPPSTRRSIELRLLKGRTKWVHESEEEFKRGRANGILNRIHYLHEKGVRFSFEIEPVTEQVARDDPEWRVEWASRAAFSLGMRTSFVRTDTGSEALLDKPLGKIIESATSLEGRSPEHFFVERDPFTGFCSVKPVRAFAALTLDAKSGRYNESYWRTFLNDQKRKDDSERFIFLIGSRVVDLTDEIFAKLLRQITSWLMQVYGRLVKNNRAIFDKLWTRITTELKRHPTSGESGVIRKDEIDWATEALNAPVGELAQILLGDPAISKLKPEVGLPTTWKAKCDELLLLPDEMRRYALTILCHNLVWLFSVDSEWVVRVLLPAIDHQDVDADAFWAGFFWGAKVPQEELFKRLKPALLQLSHRKSETRRRHSENLAGIMLAGWGRKLQGTNTRWVSDAEMTALLIDAGDDFRSQLLWYLKEWSETPNSDWESEVVWLLGDVWPRQISVKTPRVSARLAELAFDQKERFPLFVDLVLPLVVPIDQDYIHLPIHERKEDDLVEKYPQATLALLHGVLTENARQWPYGLSEILDRIGKADPKLLNDSRLIKLNRIRALA